MTIFDGIWFLIASLIIAIVLLIDPKSSASNTGGNVASGLFASPSSERSFIYRFSAVIIVLFYLLTILLNFK